MMVSFVLSFFPRGVLDEILNLIESVSEGFPSYSYNICRVFVILSFLVFVFRVALFRLFAKRYFIFSSFVIALFRLFVFLHGVCSPRKTKRHHAKRQQDEITPSKMSERRKDAMQKDEKTKRRYAKRRQN